MLKSLFPTLILLAAALPLSAADRPNVIVIMADDLGYGDIGCYGADPAAVKTPNIDALAAEGQRFTSGYSSASTCTPTRFSFLTGTHAFRQPGTGIAAPNAPAVIKPGTPTLASVLKSAGYATAVIGKWHLGLGEKAPDWNGLLKPGPLEIGFDHCFLLPTTNDRVPQVYVEDHRVVNLDPADPLTLFNALPSPDHPTGESHRDTLKMDWSKGHNQTIHNGISRIGFYTGGSKARFRDEDLADRWVKRSVDWMERQPRDRPFFLFFASHDLHVPRMPHERFQGKSGLGYRGDAIVEFDWSVGELVKTVARLGLAENTLFIVCSDNGPVLDDGYKDGAVEKNGNHTPAGPFSGGKYSVLEGGTRTPFIVRWKGRVKPAVADEVVCTIDLFTSLAAIAGAALPENGCLDSQDVSAALLGQPGAKGRSSVLQQDNGSGKFGLRAGDWKLVRHFGKAPAANPKKGKGQAKAAEKTQTTAKAPPTPAGRHTLHFLPDDPGETTDLSAKNPEKLNEMLALLEQTIAPRTARSQK